jgi:hypothetical protein
MEYWGIGVLEFAGGVDATGLVRTGALRSTTHYSIPPTLLRL